MIVSDLTMDAFAEGVSRCPLAVVPLGSTEEHGGHLPLDTDTLQVVETCKRALAEVEFLLCPPLHYGYCRSTSGHPGTISISPATVRALVLDIGMSLHRQGVRAVLFLSGHAGGGHLAAMEEAGEELLERCPGLVVAVACEYHWAREAGGKELVETGDDGHAGEIETSRVLAVDPALVQGTSPEEYPNFGKPFLARDKRAEWPGGVWGDPAKATAEKGERLYDLTASRLAEVVREMARRAGVAL